MEKKRLTWTERALIIGIRVLGIVVILVSLFSLVFSSIGPGTDVLRNWIAFFLVISGILVIILKSWPRLATIIFMLILMVCDLNHGCFIFDGHILWYLTFTFIIMGILLISNVKERFK